MAITIMTIMTITIITVRKKVIATTATRSNIVFITGRVNRFTYFLL